MKPPNCPHDGATLVPGIALVQTWRVGVPDLGGDLIRTMSPGGPGRIIPCLKCPACGYSVSFQCQPVRSAP